MKIGIGTAQLGMKYGVINNSKKLDLDNFKKILSLSLKNNISIIDTANNYGDSIKKIGHIISKNKFRNKFKIISKISGLRKVNKSNIYSHIFDNINFSLKKLKVKSLEGILIHDVKDLKSKKSTEIFNSFIKLKKKKLVKKIGFSAYKISDVLKYIKKYNFDFIQFPLNVFDQRILDKKIQKKLRFFKVELHVRSIFLQGLLLLSKKELPNNFKNKRIIKRWHKFLNDNSLDAITTCINFIKNNNVYSNIIIGFHDYQQFEDVVKNFSKKKNIILNFKNLAIKDDNIINPSKWK